jgi:two-component system, LytTR family, response regulator
VIVNTELIKELHPGFNGEYTVVLRDGTELKSSRGYRERLRNYFGDSL